MVAMVDGYHGAWLPWWMVAMVHGCHGAWVQWSKNDNGDWLGLTK